MEDTGKDKVDLPIVVEEDTMQAQEDTVLVDLGQAVEGKDCVHHLLVPRVEMASVEGVDRSLDSPEGGRKSVGALSSPSFEPFSIATIVLFGRQSHKVSEHVDVTHG